MGCAPPNPLLSIDGLLKDFGPLASLDGRMVRVLNGVSLTPRAAR